MRRSVEECYRRRERRPNGVLLRDADRSGVRNSALRTRAVCSPDIAPPRSGFPCAAPTAPRPSRGFLAPKGLPSREARSLVAVATPRESPGDELLPPFVFGRFLTSRTFSSKATGDGSAPGVDGGVGARSGSPAASVSCRAPVVPQQSRSSRQLSATTHSLVEYGSVALRYVLADPTLEDVTAAMLQGGSATLGATIGLGGAPSSTTCITICRAHRNRPGPARGKACSPGRHEVDGLPSPVAN